jgi:hypothetical protein
MSLRRAEPAWHKKAPARERRGLRRCSELLGGAGGGARQPLDAREDLLGDLGGFVKIFGVGGLFRVRRSAA